MDIADQTFEQTIGLVANPLSSKDIRRLTGLARVIDIEEKANLVARLLVGIGSVPGVGVMALDDEAGLVRRAVSLAGQAGAPVRYLPIEVEGTEADTRSAARLVADLGAVCVVTVGGDGTVRAAAEGWPGGRIVPVAAGTNNAFALTDEPTVIGLASARAATNAAAFVSTVALSVATTSGRSLAVIDAVAVQDRWVGAGAIWDPTRLVEGFVSSARRTAVGIASVSAAFGDLAPGHARHLRFGGTTTVRAVFGPGLVLDVPVADYQDLPLGTISRLDSASGLVALDGERRLPSANATIEVVTGPHILDLAAAFRDV